MLKRFAAVILFLLPLELYAQVGPGPVPYRGVNNWNLIFGTDNVFDIGANAAQRPRTGYFGTSVVTPALTVSSMTAGRVPFSGSGGLQVDDADLTFDGTILSSARYASAAADNCATPPYSFGTDTDTGICSSALDTINVRTGGTNRLTLNSSGINGSAGVSVILSDSSVFSASSLRLNTDTTLSREAAAIFQLGLDVNGATVANTLKAGDGITGTNVSGAALTLAGGRATGSAAGGDLRLQGSAALASGTTAQTLGDRMYIRAQQKTLTESAATAFAQVSVASGAFTGGEVNYTIVASDGTDHQSRHGRINFSAVNKAGTETCVMAPGTVDQTTDGNAGAISSGTLTYAVTCATTPTNGIQFEVNAVSSLTQTTLAVFWSIRLDGPGTVTPQ
jgi:hypothetical protein